MTHSSYLSRSTGMTKFASLLALSFAALTGACTITTSNDIDPTTLSGYVAGQQWTMVAGSADVFSSSEDFFAVMYPRAYTPCSSEPSGPHILVSIPMQVGDYSMNLSRNMTFTDGENNLIATDGRIVVDSVSSTHITGGLHGTYDLDNEVSGQFDLTICP